MPAKGVIGAEAWRALKSRYDPETAITLEAWRGELFKVRRCAKITEVVSRLTQWENKMNRLDNALRASGKPDISDEDKTMVLKDLIPVEMEEELRKMIKRIILNKLNFGGSRFGYFSDHGIVTF